MYLLISDVTCQNQAFVTEISCWIMILLRKNVTLASYDILFMFLCLISSKLCLSEEAVVLNLCKITEPRKHAVKILHGLKNFEKKFLILIVFYDNLGLNVLHFQKITSSRIFWD